MKKIYDHTWDSLKIHDVPEWYHDYKLGIFIHWGIYSVPAYAPQTCELGEIPGDANWFCNNPYSEWYFNSVNVGYGPTYEYHQRKYGNDFRYEDFIPRWKAKNWQPGEWADLFRKAGARYVVLVTKHHDGFCLFPSKHTSYHSISKGPNRDIVGELTRSVKDKGMKMGLYYSGIIDWKFAPNPIYKEQDNFTKSCPTHEYADYAYKQCIELIDNYKPSILWNDIGWPKQGEHMLPHLLSYFYNQVEDGVVNDRFNGLYRDFATKEYKYGDSGRDMKWEMVRGMGLSFGYNAEESEDEIISTSDLIHLLAATVADNGNLLINIGPRADGTIPEAQEKRLMELGRWLSVNGDAIYETRCSRHLPQVNDAGQEIFFTKKGSDLYILIDKIKGPEAVIHINAVQGIPVALDETLDYTFQQENDGIDISINNYRREQYILSFKVPNGEK